MDPLHLVGRAQAPLVEEEWKQLDEGVVKAARRVLVGRKVLPVKSWGIYIGILGKRQKHIIIAQNYFEYSNGIYDLDYTAIPLSWACDAKIVDKGHVAQEEAEQLFTSFLRGGRRVFRHKQQKVRNHEKLD